MLKFCAMIQTLLSKHKFFLVLWEKALKTVLYLWRGVVCDKRLQYDIKNFMQEGEFLKSF